MKDNELIARFMGFKKKSVPTTDSIFRRREWYIPAFGYYNTEELKYNESLDWLMPVIEKIEHLVEEVRVKSVNEEGAIWYECLISDMDGLLVRVFDKNRSKISIIYEAVVEFIKWHNENKSKQV